MCLMSLAVPQTGDAFSAATIPSLLRNSLMTTRLSAMDSNASCLSKGGCSGSRQLLCCFVNKCGTLFFNLESCLRKYVCLSKDLAGNASKDTGVCMHVQRSSFTIWWPESYCRFTLGKLHKSCKPIATHWLLSSCQCNIKLCWCKRADHSSKKQGIVLCHCAIGHTSLTWPVAQCADRSAPGIALTPQHLCNYHRCNLKLYMCSCAMAFWPWTRYLLHSWVCPQSHNSSAHQEGQPEFIYLFISFHFYTIPVVWWAS